MATVVAPANVGYPSTPYTVNLSNAQTGNGQSTNIVDRGTVVASNYALLKLTSTIGATPTVTLALEGSADGTNWYSVAYTDSATPTTVAVATIVITTATTSWKTIRSEIPWRFFRITYSANTNVTMTADIWV